MPRIRCGLVGLGHNGKNLIKEITWMPALRRRLDIVAGCDPDPQARDKATQLARGCRLKEFAVHETMTDMLTKGTIDAIIINSPPHEHAAQSANALESGLHVYAEVPMALTVTDIEKIIGAEGMSGMCYQQGENYCFFTEVLYAGHLSRQGQLGVPVAVTTEFQIDEDPRKDWRARLDPLMYGHTIGPALVAIGGIEAPARIAEVTSFGSRASVDKDEGAFFPAFTYHEALFLTEEGTIVRCVNAYTSTRPHGRFRFEITGSKATFECSRPGGRALLSARMMSAPRARVKWSRPVGQITMARVIKPAIGNFHGARTRVFVDWADAITNHRKPLLSAAIAANACAAGIAASESARQRGQVRVKQFDK